MAHLEAHYFRNNTLTVACPLIQPFFQCNVHELGGFMGQPIDEIFEALRWRMKIVEGEKTLGDNSGGIFNGIYGSLQKRESDWFPFPMPMDPADDVPINYGPAVGEMSHRILAEYTIDSKSTHILHSLNVFTLNIWCLIVITLFVISLTFRLISRKRFLDVFWDMLRILLEQGVVDQRFYKERMLTITYTLGSFVLFMGYFCNLISTDKVAIDLSDLTESLADILRKNRSVKILEADPRTVIYRNAKSGSIYDKIWQKRHLLRLGNFSSDDAVSYAYISYPHMLRLIATTICKPEKQRTWISRRDMDSAVFFFIRRQNMTQKAYRALDYFYYQAIERGLFEKIIEVMIENFRDFMAKSGSCLRNNIQNVLDDLKENESTSDVPLKSMAPLFLCFGFSLLFCLLIHFFQILYYRVVSKKSIW